MQKAVEEEREFFLECEKNWIFLTLIMIGGYYGAYTFCVRGGVFCNAQTANIVLLGMALGQFWFRSLLTLPEPSSPRCLQKGSERCRCFVGTRFLF